VRPDRRAVSLPIFDTASVKPTPFGLQALNDLLKAILEQNPAEIVIVGHTDERGADEYNLRVSETRARAVARFLTTNGIRAKITTIGRGWHEPFMIDTGELSKSDVWALNRRVEWRWP
jgi:outer membrane protein OmpA-like peptidoglycan-associated protein